MGLYDTRPDMYKSSKTRLSVYKKYGGYSGWRGHMIKDYERDHNIPKSQTAGQLYTKSITPEKVNVIDQTAASKTKKGVRRGALGRQSNMLGGIATALKSRLGQ